MSSESKESERLYSCRHCGIAYTAYPPDDVKKYALVNLDPLPDELQITYKCPECQEENRLVWSRNARWE